MKTIRKILINISAAFLLFPMIFLLRYLPNVIRRNYQYYDTTFEDPIEYVRVILHDFGFPFISVFFCILTLLPFQLIKDFNYKKGKRITFIKKNVILSTIFFIEIFIFALFTYGGIHTPWWENYIYIVLSIIIGIVFATFLYFTVDRYVEKEQ